MTTKAHEERLDGPSSAAEPPIVEQAKGVLAGHAAIGVDDAFARLRRYARHHDLPLIGVCEEVVAGTLILVTISETRSARRH